MTTDVGRLVSRHRHGAPGVHCKRDLDGRLRSSGQGTYLGPEGVVAVGGHCSLNPPQSMDCPLHFRPRTEMFALRAGCIAVVLLSLPLTVRADRLQLSNGDEIEGELLEMSGDQVKFRHPILGTFTIPRQQVHAIELGEQRGGNRLLADGTTAPPETAEEVIDRLVNPDLNRAAVKEAEKGSQRHATPQDAVEQLRNEGVDAKRMSQLHSMVPGFGSPVVQQHFQDRVTGLMNGSLTINDIRNEAIDARDQLKELMDELGPGGEALRGYYGILDGFIEKTDPSAPRSTPGIPPLTPQPIPPR